MSSFFLSEIAEKDIDDIVTYIAQDSPKAAYEDVNDLFEIASIYCIAIAQGHLFNDGNKRTAFSVMYNFLEINGYELEAKSEVIVDIMLKIAEKKLTKKQLSKWIKENVLVLNLIKN